MNRLERYLRAAAATATGFLYAPRCQHSNGVRQPYTRPPVRACPFCERTLTTGPHFHPERQVIVWPTKDPHAIIVTDIDGGPGLLLYEGHTYE